jgi:hypothetical protein
LENIMSKDIRAVIDQCPEVGRILEEYGIGCAPCSVGSCLVSDIEIFRSLRWTCQKLYRKRLITLRR